jgi:hypothetical protein
MLTVSTPGGRVIAPPLTLDQEAFGRDQPPLGVGVEMTSPGQQHSAIRPGDPEEAVTRQGDIEGRCGRFAGDFGEIEAAAA